MRRKVGISLNYPLHFTVLAVVSTTLAFAGHWRPVLDPLPSVGLYGLLHSSMVATALRRRQTPLRIGSFVAAAGGLAMLSLEFARLVSGKFAALPGSWSPALLLTLASGFGAAGYGWLIRRCMIPDLRLRAGLRLTLCCVTGTLLALPLGIRLHLLGGWWFALIWWWTFSLALWDHDVRVQPIEFRQQS